MEAACTLPHLSFSDTNQHLFLLLKIPLHAFWSANYLIYMAGARQQGLEV